MRAHFRINTFRFVWGVQGVTTICTDYLNDVCMFIDQEMGLH